MFLAYRFLLFLRCFTFCSQARHGSWLWHGSSSTAVSGQFPPCGTVCIIKRHDATYWGQSHHISLGCTTFCWRGAVDRSQRAQRDCGKSLGSPTSFVGFQCADHGLRSMSQVWKLLRIHLSEFVVQRQCLVPVCELFVAFATALHAFNGKCVWGRENSLFPCREGASHFKTSSARYFCFELPQCPQDIRIGEVKAHWNIYVLSTFTVFACICWNTCYGILRWKQWFCLLACTQAPMLELYAYTYIQMHVRKHTSYNIHHT